MVNGYPIELFWDTLVTIYLVEAFPDICMIRSPDVLGDHSRNASSLLSHATFSLDIGASPS
jgi:hypothetical protein